MQAKHNKCELFGLSIAHLYKHGSADKQIIRLDHPLYLNINYFNKLK